MGNLIAVKRFDKNGKLVTRHVKQGQQSNDALKALKPPTVKASAKKVEKYQSPNFASDSDPRLEQGQSFDRIVCDDQIFSRSREGITPHIDVSRIRVQFNRPMNEEEHYQLASLVGYLWKTDLRTPEWEEVQIDSHTSHSATFAVNASYSKRSDPQEALVDFDSKIKDFIHSGSPIRTTNRSGSNTKGTSAVPGIKDDWVGIEIYYDAFNGDDAVVAAATDRGLDDLQVIDEVLNHDVQVLSDGLL